MPLYDRSQVDDMIRHLKHDGTFDYLRKGCLAHVDTLPAYNNLKLRVSTYIQNLLSRQPWPMQMEKQEFREAVRLKINEDGMLACGVERIIKGVMPTMKDIIRDRVEQCVRDYLDLSPDSLLGMNANIDEETGVDPMLPFAYHPYFEATLQVKMEREVNVNQLHHLNPYDSPLKNSVENKHSLFDSNAVSSDIDKSRALRNSVLNHKTSGHGVNNIITDETVIIQCKTESNSAKSDDTINVKSDSVNSSSEINHKSKYDDSKKNINICSEENKLTNNLMKHAKSSKLSASKYEPKLLYVSDINNRSVLPVQTDNEPTDAAKIKSKMKEIIDKRVLELKNSLLTSLPIKNCEKGAHSKQLLPRKERFRRLKLLQRKRANSCFSRHALRKQCMPKTKKVEKYEIKTSKLKNKTIGYVSASMDQSDSGKVKNKLRTGKSRKDNSKHDVESDNHGAGKRQNPQISSAKVNFHDESSSKSDNAANGIGESATIPYSRNLRARRTARNRWYYGGDYTSFSSDSSDEKGPKSKDEMSKSLHNDIVTSSKSPRKSKNRGGFKKAKSSSDVAKSSSDLKSLCYNERVRSNAGVKTSADKNQNFSRSHIKTNGERLDNVGQLETDGDVIEVAKESTLNLVMPGENTKIVCHENHDYNSIEDVYVESMTECGDVHVEDEADCNKNHTYSYQSNEVVIERCESERDKSKDNYIVATGDAFAIGSEISTNIIIVNKNNECLVPEQCASCDVAFSKNDISGDGNVFPIENEVIYRSHNSGDIVKMDLAQGEDNTSRSENVMSLCGEKLRDVINNVGLAYFMESELYHRPLNEILFSSNRGNANEKSSKSERDVILSACAPANNGMNSSKKNRTWHNCVGMTTGEKENYNELENCITIRGNQKCFYSKLPLRVQNVNDYVSSSRDILLSNNNELTDSPDNIYHSMCNVNGFKKDVSGLYWKPSVGGCSHNDKRRSISETRKLNKKAK